MPRDGSQQYHVPPGTQAITNYTVESTKYNAFTADLEQDLNLPRPIVAGGTGASDAATAMNNLGGELARQVIANYNSDPFQAGSFYSAAGATNAPTANAFTGICYVSGAVPALTDMFIEARDQLTGVLYIRQKKANVWGGWIIPAGVASGPTPPTGVAANTLWWDPNRGKLFIYYQDVDSSQWVEAVAVPDLSPNNYVRIIGETMTGPLVLPADPTTALQAATKQYVDAGNATVIAALGTQAVRYDTAQALTAAQQVQARQNIYAAPFDAMAYNGLQLNGSMEVSQERGTSGTTTNGAYICDGYKISWAGTMVIAGAQASAVGFFSGFPYLIYQNVQTAEASLGAGDFAVIQANIEGWRVARLGWGTANAQPLTIGFWTCHHRTGVYSVGIRNGVLNRSYVTTYTQIAADVPQYNVITIPGDQTGTWAADNTAGLSITFTMACGTTYTIPSANTWTAGNYLGAPGQVNAVAATTDVFRLTGFLAIPGIEAPSAARSSLIMRPYDQELITCQRYYAKSFGIGVNPANNVDARDYNCTCFSAGNLISHHIPYPVRMRAAPTMTYWQPSGVTGGAYLWSWFNGAVWAASTGTMNLNAGNDTGFAVSFTVGGGATGSSYLVQGGWTADARL